MNFNLPRCLKDNRYAYVYLYNLYCLVYVYLHTYMHDSQGLDAVCLGQEADCHFN